MTDKPSKANYYDAEDYAGATIGHHQFYYGYEATICEHGSDSKECDCEKDWCFIASYCGREVMRYSSKQMKIDRFNVQEGLIKGVLAYILAYADVDKIDR